VTVHLSCSQKPLIAKTWFTRQSKVERKHLAFQPLCSQKAKKGLVMVWEPTESGHHK
jgi:hypothetical protein